VDPARAGRGVRHLAGVLRRAAGGAAVALHDRGARARVATSAARRRGARPPSPRLRDLRARDPAGRAAPAAPPERARTAHAVESIRSWLGDARQYLRP